MKTSYINPKKCHKIRSSKSSSVDYGLPIRVFVNKDSPDYKYHWGSELTDRQKRILNGEIPLESIRFNELTVIMKKAEQLGDLDSAEKAETLYNQKKYPDDETYHPSMNYEEAVNFLNNNNDI